MSKFAPHVPESLINAVSLILDEAKVEPDAPDAAAVARRKALQAIKDRQEDEKAEKGETKPKNASTKVAGHQYGGAKQKHEPEIEEELKGNQHKIDANKNGKIDADDFKKLRGEELKGNQHKIDANKNGKIDSHDFKLLRGKKKANEDIELDERELSPSEADKKEKYVKSMKKGLAGFKARYGSKAKNVMYATATKMAKNEEVNHIEEAIVNHEDIAKHLIKKHGKDVSMDHIENAIDGMDDAHKVDKREVLYHVKKLTKEEVEINEGKMKDIHTDMMDHATKKGYSSHKEFTPADYDTVGKQHGISGKELAVLAGHKTAAKVANEDVDSKKKDLPFIPDKPRAPIATAGKYGYGPSAAKHLAKLGMKNLKKEETVIEGTGGPIYPKPFVKLGDLLARAKDMRNIKQATIVTPKSENEVVLKKEESEQVDETMMGKAGCTSEDDKKKAEKRVDYDKPTFLRKKDDWRKSNPAYLPKPTKEEVEQIDEVTYSVKDKFKHSENGHIQLSQQAHTGPDAKDQIWHVTHETFKLDTKNPRRGGDFHSKTLHSFNGEDAEKQAREKFGELKDKHDVKAESVDRIDELSNKLLKKYDDAVEKKHTVRDGNTATSKYDNSRISGNRIVGAIRSSKRQAGFKGNTDKVSRADHYKAIRKEEIEQLDELSPKTLASYANKAVGDTSKDRSKMIKVADKKLYGNPDLRYKTEQANESRGHKTLATFFKNREVAQRAYQGNPAKDAEVAQGGGSPADQGIAAAKADYKNKSKLPMSKAAGVLAAEEAKIDELSKKTLGSYISKAADPLSKKSNVNLSSRAASKLASVSSYDSGKDDGSKDDNKAYLRSKGIQHAAKRLSKEEVSIDETAVLDKYIRSMGYDPQHLDKNKKVMFAKTNAYKTFASSQKTEGLYDGGQKGTQDIDVHMSPGATARG